MNSGISATASVAMDAIVAGDGFDCSLKSFLDGTIGGLSLPAPEVSAVVGNDETNIAHALPQSPFSEASDATSPAISLASLIACSGEVSVPSSCPSRTASRMRLKTGPGD